MNIMLDSIDAVLQHIKEYNTKLPRNKKVSRKLLSGAHSDAILLTNNTTGNSQNVSATILISDLENIIESLSK